MSLLSLDSSFQNPSQNRHGSLANVTSSIHSSPKSNVISLRSHSLPPNQRNTLKPTSSSKSIEKPPNPRNNSSTKKAPLAKTPQKYTSRDNFSPVPLSKRSIPRNDANPEFKRTYDASPNHRALPQDQTLKRSSSKPLANISMCSSRVSSNLTHSDLRQSTFDKLNESIEALAKSALAESLSQAKNIPPARGSQSSSRKPPPAKSREPEVSSFNASGSKNQALSMSGSKRNIMNSQNTSFVMQKVYSVNNKALNLTNLLTRPRSREDLSSRQTSLSSATRKDIKENDPKFTPVRQSLDHTSSSSTKLNMQKRLSEPAVKSKGLEVRNLNTSNISQETPYIPSSLVKSLIGGGGGGGGGGNSNLGDITKITEKDESSQFCVGDNTVSFGDCNHTLSHYIKTEEKEDVEQELALNSLKERFDVFVGTISTVLDEAAFREKRSFFIKLLTMIHTHKVKLSKFLASQEANKKAFYFDLWHQALGQPDASIVCEKEAGIDQMLEEAQLSRAIAFHSNKLFKKYFYQGFLGHYVICKLGPESLQQQQQQQEQEELLPAPILKQDKRSKSPSTRTPQDKRKSFPINESASASKTTNQRSKTPTNSQSLNIANFNLKPTSTRKFTPTDRSFRSQTCLTSPNQSFIKGSRYPPKGSKGTKEIMSASVLEQSFGCENSKTLITEELIPDQIMTKIPQPQKKEGLETLRFDSPRRMNTRNYTLESTERSIKSSTTGGSNIKQRAPSSSQNRFGNSPSYQQSQKKKPQGLIPEKKEFTKVLKKKYEPSSRETTTPPLRQKTRSISNLKRTEEKSVSSFTKGMRASYEEDDFFEVSEHNLQKALAFRKKKLTQFYGQKFLNILVASTNRKIQAAWFLRIRNLLRKGLLGFLQAVELKDTISEIKEEEEEENHKDSESDEEEESENMKMMMNIAKEHYETSIKINVFNNFLEYFVQSHEEGNMIAQYRDNTLKRSCFIKWFEVLPQLKEEDEKFELAYETIIKKFRFIMLAEKALRQWRTYIAEGGKNQQD